MDKDLKTILKEKMAERGISTPKLGKRLGIPPDRIYAWYRDNTNPKGPDSQRIQSWIDDLNFIVKNEENANPDIIYNTVDGQKILVEAKSFTSKEPTAMQILDRLSQAFIDQAKAMADQAEGFKAQAEAFKTQSELLKSIESKMAREKTLADVALNLQRVFGGVETMGERQEAAIKTILSDLNKIKTQTKVPS